MYVTRLVIEIMNKNPPHETKYENKWAPAKGDEETEENEKWLMNDADEDILSLFKPF